MLYKVKNVDVTLNFMTKIPQAMKEYILLPFIITVWFDN